MARPKQPTYANGVMRITNKVLGQIKLMLLKKIICATFKNLATVDERSKN